VLFPTDIPGYNASTQSTITSILRVRVMDTPAQVPGPPSRHREFEDPHYHDDPDFETASDDKEPVKRKTKPPARQLPPPRRRFED